MRWLRTFAGILVASLALNSATAQPQAEPLLRPAPPTLAGKATAPLVQSAATDEAIAAFIDGYVSDAVDRSGLPGGAIVVMRDGRTILAKGYGYADFKSRRPVTVDRTLFRQASISKPFVWILAMQLVEEGKLDLDADVNRYLDFRVPEAFGKPITMRHLMTHTPGFAERFRGVYEPDVSRPLGEVLRNNIPARVYAPGSTVAYSNYGSGLAAYVVQRLRGQPFERLVEERIFRPLGMARSTFAQPLPKHLLPMLVSGYRPGSREPLPFEVIGTPPSGALTASPADMGRFLGMLMNGGQGESGRVLAAPTLARMMQLDRPLVPGGRAGFGHGFMVQDHRGVRAAGHGGNLSGTATDLIIFPGHGLGWHIAFNGQGQDSAASRLRSNLVRAVVARFLAPTAPAVRAQGPSTAKDLEGTWLSTRRVRSGIPTLANVEALVTARADEDGALRLSNVRLADGSERRWLPAGRDRFVEEETGALLVAKRDSGGKVVRFASPLAYSVAEFDRASGVEWVVKPLFAFALAMLVLAAIAGPLGWAMRRTYKVEKAPHGRRARVTLPAARIGTWIILGTLLGWFLFVSALQADVDLLFGKGRSTAVALILASWLSVLAAILIAADAVLAWRDPARGWPRRIGAVLTAVAALIVAWLLIAFDLTSFSTDY